MSDDEYEYSSTIYVEVDLSQRDQIIAEYRITEGDPDSAEGAASGPGLYSVGMSPAGAKAADGWNYKIDVISKDEDRASQAADEIGEHVKSIGGRVDE